MTEFTKLEQTKSELDQLSAVDQQIDETLEQQTTLSESISAVLANLRKTRLSLNESLTAIPAHPYEKFKHEYLNTPGCSAVTFEDLPLITSFDQKTISNQLSAIRDRFREDFQTKLPALTSSDFLQHPELSNVFSVLSGEKYVIDKAKIAKHLQHIEMVKSIPLDELKKNPTEIAQKILSHFIQTYS